MKIPQMNYMNWLILFLGFYASVAIAMSWTHFNV